MVSVYQFCDDDDDDDDAVGEEVLKNPFSAGDDDDSLDYFKQVKPSTVVEEQ